MILLVWPVGDRLLAALGRDNSFGVYLRFIAVFKLFFSQL